MRTAKRGGGTSPNPPPNLQTQLHARTAMGALEAAIEHRFAGTTRAAATLNAS